MSNNPLSLEQATDAISFIDSTDRGTWINIGMAMKDEFGEEGLNPWLDWSSQANSFKRKDAISVWRSFKKSGVSIGTLLHEAKTGGYIITKSQPISEEEKLRRQLIRDKERKVQDVEAEIAQENACREAQDVMNQSRVTTNLYLANKGLPDYKMSTIMDGDVLVVPMRIGNKLVGVQRIYENGTKLFLSGQEVIFSEYVLGNRTARNHFFVEGYASGLTVYTLLKHLDICVHICFTAYNAYKIAALKGSGIFIADNDKSGTGEKYARESGLPYWMSDTEGFDVNDEYCRDGVVPVQNSLKRRMLALRGLR